MITSAPEGAILQDIEDKLNAKYAKEGGKFVVAPYSIGDRGETFKVSYSREFYCSVHHENLATSKARDDTVEMVALTIKLPFFADILAAIKKAMGK